MTEHIIGVKELYKNLNKIYKKTAKGESFIVVRRSKPMFEINPYKKKKWQAGKKSLWEEFKDLRFRSGEKDLSKRIDEIVYGV